MALEAFLVVLEYLYTDHAPIQEDNAVQVLALANQYALPRLVAVCELFISEQVRRFAADGIAQEDLDIIGVWCIYTYSYVIVCE